MTCPAWCTADPHASQHDPCLPITYVEHHHRVPLRGHPVHYVEIVQLSEHLGQFTGPGTLSETPPVLFAPPAMTDDLTPAQARALATALLAAADTLDPAAAHDTPGEVPE